MTSAIAITIDSFQITGRGIILDLQHDLEGLPKGTILNSKIKKLNWEVVSRLVFDHPDFKQFHFKNETKDYMRLTFDSSEKLKESVDKIYQKEKGKTYQYLVKPIDHNQKPDNNENLEVKLPTTHV